MPFGLLSFGKRNAIEHPTLQTKPPTLRRHSLGWSRNPPSPRTSAEARGTFLHLCLLASQSQLRTLPLNSAEDYMKIALQPIGTGHDNVHIIVERSRWCPLNFSGFNVHNLDRDVSKQRARNVPLASTDVIVEGRLRDDPKEGLRRSLVPTELIEK